MLATCCLVSLRAASQSWGGRATASPVPYHGGLWHSEAVTLDGSDEHDVAEAAVRRAPAPAGRGEGGPRGLVHPAVQGATLRGGVLRDQEDVASHNPGALGGR